MERLDAMLEKLRDKAVIKLHTGDNTSMTKEDIPDSFIDENGFIHLLHYNNSRLKSSISTPACFKIDKSVPFFNSLWRGTENTLQSF